MYLLRKLGLPLIALLVLSILALITVVLLFENNGLQLPVFDRPQKEIPESGIEITLASALFDIENSYSILIGGNFYEQALSNPSY